MENRDKDYRACKDIENVEQNYLEKDLLLGNKGVLLFLVYFVLNLGAYYSYQG